MEKVDYVSYDVAELLKEEGYDGDCPMKYLTRDMDSFKVKKGDLSLASYSTDGESVCIKAPSLYEAQKWLREKHCLHIHLYYNCGWNYVIWDIDEMVWVGEEFEFHSYEEALNEGIKEALMYI